MEIVGSRIAPGSLRLDEPPAGLEQRRVDRRDGAAGRRLEELELVGQVGAQRGRQLAAQVVLGHPGQDPAVALDAGPAGHHVARATTRAAGWARSSRRTAAAAGRGTRDAAPTPATIAPSTSSPNSPASASSITRVSGSRWRRVRWFASRVISVASRGTALAPDVGVEAWPASPSAVTSVPRRGLLADVDRDDDATVGQLQTLAAALVERVVGGDVGAGLDQPRHPDLLGAVLLVGLGDEHQVAAGLEPRTGERGHGHGPARGLVLHVHRAAAPDVAVVVEVAVERRVLPVLGVGRDDVRVAEQRQGRPLAGAGDAGDQVGAVGIAGHQLAGDAVCLEVVLEQHRGGRLPPRRVRGVDPDQVA